MSEIEKEITPREVADKSAKEALQKAIRMALAIESDAVRLNTQTFNRNRYTAVAEIEDYEALKDRAREIKEYSIENNEKLLGRLRQVIEKRGGHFYPARTKEEACEYVKNVCLKHEAKLVVKAKSMTSEEIKLNHTLEEAGIEVAETDLAEFILQVSDEQPSHIVAPAIHRSRERISELFKEKFDTDQPLDTGEDLTKFARKILRQKFLTADVGISGANVISADTGTIVLVESEGNIRMVTQAPPVHIAIAGIEKVIPRREDLAVFIELLAPSATGQPLTSYTNIIDPPLDLPPFSFDGRPKKEREFHLVLVDNGRSNMRKDPELKQALYCVRCSACLNVCPVFQTVGGHAFGGETYSGGIGGAWEAGTGTLENAGFSELCTGCSRCIPQCPVKIDIPWLNTVLRNRLNHPDGKKAPAQKRFFGNFASSARIASLFTPVSNRVSNFSVSRSLLEHFFGVDRRRELQNFAGQTLTKRFKKANIQASEAKSSAVLFADVYTNYQNPDIGLITAKVMAKLGVEITLSDVLPEGRASQSQGLIDIARKRAQQTARYLEKMIDAGKPVIVTEPSVLALFRLDYRNLLNDAALFQKLKKMSYDPIEYILHLFTENGMDWKKCFSPQKLSQQKLFIHGHCQQKTIGAFDATVTLFRQLGFDVVTSSVECCGMAGSFGYKKQFYEVSKKVGEDLLDQIGQADEADDERLVLAGGISCREQIRSELNRPVYHPMEVLEKIIG